MAITLERRSPPQSRTLHKAIRAYCDTTGEPFELVKTKWKFHIGAYVPVPISPDELAVWKPPDWPGRFVSMPDVHVYRGKRVPAIFFLKSEAAYTKDEEARVLDHAIEECQRVDADTTWLPEG